MNLHPSKPKSAASKVVLCLAALFLAGSSKDGTSKAEFGWLAYGDLRGYLEPCGCDPDSDLGGVKRIRAQLERERQQHGAFDVYELGNILPPPDARQERKIPFLLTAAQEIKPDAALFNHLELAYESRFGDALRKRATYVLSNRAEKSWVQQSIVTQHAIVLGYVSPTLQSGLRKFDSALEKQWASLLNKAKGRKRILLFSGPAGELKKIQAAKLFDEIIRSSSRPLSDDPDLREKDDESLLFDEASQTWQVPLGGQGLLRGGRMLQAQTLSLQEMVQDSGWCQSQNLPLTTQTGTCKPQVLPGLSEIKRITWLPRSVGGENLFQELFAKYSASAKNEFEAIAKERLADLKTSPFAGAESCQSCHPKAYETWKGSSHAHAFATLKKQDKHFDGECVSCHVVGAKEKGGFVSEEASPHLANVQCETCHGPRKDHVANPAIKVQAAADNCQQCHHQPHSAAFSFPDYWKKIQHGKQ